jgi:hypothetical protein
MLMAVAPGRSVIRCSSVTARSKAAIMAMETLTKVLKYYAPFSPSNFPCFSPLYFSFHFFRSFTFHFPFTCFHVFQFNLFSYLVFFYDIACHFDMLFFETLFMTLTFTG